MGTLVDFRVWNDWGLFDCRLKRLGIGFRSPRARARARPPPPPPPPSTPRRPAAEGWRVGMQAARRRPQQGVACAEPLRVGAPVPPRLARPHASLLLRPASRLACLRCPPAHPPTCLFSRPAISEIMSMDRLTSCLRIRRTTRFSCSMRSRQGVRLRAEAPSTRRVGTTAHPAGAVRPAARLDCRRRRRRRRRCCCFTPACGLSCQAQLRARRRQAGRGQQPFLFVCYTHLQDLSRHVEGEVSRVHHPLDKGQVAGHQILVKLVCNGTLKERRLGAGSVVQIVAPAGVLLPLFC